MAYELTPFERAMALAAISGLRVTMGPAFLYSSQRRPERRGWLLAALGEMVLDKIGILPSRYRLPLLIPRTIAGAWVAHQSLQEDGVDDPSGAILGAVVAAGTACVAPMSRNVLSRGLDFPDALLGLAEDYLALRLGSRATGLSMDEIATLAREAVSDTGEEMKPMLESIAEWISPSATPASMPVPSAR
jgi:hypothetical protein